MSFNGIEEVYCALYVDFDNIFTRLYELDPELAHEFGSNPKRWIRWIEGHAVKILYGEGVRRRILKRVCYLNPRRYQEYRSYFTMAAFQVVDCPPMTRQEKTSTDIHLVMDCLDALHHQTHFGEFIILSGDSDFTPLLLRLQEYARKTLVLSVGYTSPAYASAATWRIREDWFITQSLEKEELPEGEYDDYDMDNRHEMAVMREYQNSRNGRSRHNQDDELLQSYDDATNASQGDDHERSSDRSYDRNHDRPKRYDRHDRDGYDRRKNYRDYQRPSYGSGYQPNTHDPDANGPDANGTGQNGADHENTSETYGNTPYANRDERPSYGYKKYSGSQRYYQDNRFQDYRNYADDEEESRVTVPVKIISYGKAKAPEASEVSEGTVALEEPVLPESLEVSEAEETRDSADVYNEASCVDDCSVSYEGLDISEDAEDVSDEFAQDDYDGGDDFAEASDVIDEAEDVDSDEDDAVADDDDDDASGNTQVFKSIGNPSAHGYASYASTLRQHGYADDVDDDDDYDDEVNGNIAEPVEELSISEQAAEILKAVVMESAQPVPAANIGQILQRKLGAGLDWFGFGKLRDFLDHLDLSPLEFSPVPPGYLYDPNRHERPEERGSNDEFRSKYPELFAFALSVHRATDMPLLLPEHYKQILGYIVEEVNTKGFFMTTTSRNVRDRCIEDGLPIARSHVNFVIVGVGRGGCPLNDKQGISMRDVAKAFLRNAYDLCRTAQMELGDHERLQLMEWIMPKE